MTGSPGARWQQLARRLADQVAADDALHSDVWRAAIEQTPRHVFVPRFHVQQPDGDWITTADGDDGWLEAVYRNEPLVTALATTATGAQVTVSSSTKPGLMTRMLEALDIHDGHRVLEIGTGTGYNAALLCHRLGAEQVFSIDIGANLVTAARGRLATLGYVPFLAVGDGTDGLPAQGPFDRIIATCSVPAIPWSWAEQLRPGGLLLADFKRTVHAGNLVLLTRYPDRLEGRFLPRWAGFMAARRTDAAPELTHTQVDRNISTRSTTLLDPLPWNSLIPWFLAQADLPTGVVFGYRGADREWADFSAPNGSWCSIRTLPDPNGDREVRQGGPVQIWDRVEKANERWIRTGRPDWARFGLTVRPGSQRLWLDQPDSNEWWELPR